MRADPCLRRLGHPSGARGLARGCHCDAATVSISAGWPRADTAAHARGYGFARACLRARPGGGAPQPSALALALDEPATHHAVSSTAASWRSFCLRDLICTNPVLAIHTNRKHSRWSPARVRLGGHVSRGRSSKCASAVLSAAVCGVGEREHPLTLLSSASPEQIQTVLSLSTPSPLHPHLLLTPRFSPHSQLPHSQLPPSPALPCRAYATSLRPRARLRRAHSRRDQAEAARIARARQLAR